MGSMMVVAGWSDGWAPDVTCFSVRSEGNSWLIFVVIRYQPSNQQRAKKHDHANVIFLLQVHVFATCTPCIRIMSFHGRLLPTVRFPGTADLEFAK